MTPCCSAREPSARLCRQSTLLSQRLHYKEFLVELINRDGLDPAELFDRLEMEAELRRWQVPVPATRQQESDAAYLRRLRQVSDPSVTPEMACQFSPHFPCFWPTVRHSDWPGGGPVLCGQSRTFLFLLLLLAWPTGSLGRSTGQLVRGLCNRPPAADAA